MVVCNKHIEAQFLLSIIYFFDRIYTAVHAYNYLRIRVFSDIIERRNAYAVPVAVSVGNKIIDLALTDP